MHPHGQGVYEVLTRQSAAAFSPPPNAALQPEHHINVRGAFLSAAQGFFAHENTPAANAWHGVSFPEVDTLHLKSIPSLH